LAFEHSGLKAIENSTSAACTLRATQHSLHLHVVLIFRQTWRVVGRIRQNSDLNYNASLSIASGIQRFSGHGAITLVLAVRFPCEKQLRTKSAGFKFSVINLCLRVFAEPESNAMKMQVVRQASCALRQFTPCILAAGIGIGVSVTAASMTANRENRNAAQQFNVMAENNSMVVQNGVNE
jgi:hypothetical protein